MSDGENLPPIASEERLARFIFYRRHIRNDGSLRPDAFIPHPYPDLSVTRHLQLSQAQIWDIGHLVARQVGHTLQGRADLAVAVFQRQKLQVVAAPVPENPNHANVIDWPPEKSAQKSIGQQIAEAAGKAQTSP